MSVRATDAATSLVFSLERGCSFPLENEFYEIAQDEIGEQQKEQDVQIDKNDEQHVAEKRRVLMEAEKTILHTSQESESG